jgi:TetR/AcrR family transcriptional regulator, lmrAB and yxaGH operons repressor
MIVGAASMIGTGGVDAMSLRDLAITRGVPLGSTYHHFPGGKAQLVDEAVLLVGHSVVGILDSTRDGGPAEALQVFADVWRKILRRSDFREGCPVSAAATATDRRHHATARRVFDAWHRALVETLIAGGVPAARAPRLAVTIVATLEGSVALSRAQESIQPLEDAVAELTEIIAGAAGG